MKKLMSCDKNSTYSKTYDFDTVVHNARYVIQYQKEGTLKQSHSYTVIFFITKESFIVQL